MLENVDYAPLGGADEDPRAPTINATNVDVGPRANCGVQSQSMIRECVVIYMDNIDKGNSAHGSHSPFA
jgi:hypothetical protein